MIFLELLYKKKEKTRIDYLIDETDVDSYFFHNFLDVYVVRKRVLRLSKSLFREAYSIKVFTFDPTYCVSKLQFYGWITPHKERIFVYSENLKLIKKSYEIISKSVFIPYPIPKFVKTHQQSPYSFISLRIFKVQIPAWFGLESDFQRFALKNSTILSYPLISTSISKNLTIYSLNIYKKFN